MILNMIFMILKFYKPFWVVLPRMTQNIFRELVIDYYLITISRNILDCEYK
jgi:hypothetical protein